MTEVSENKASCDDEVADLSTTISSTPPDLVKCPRSNCNFQTNLQSSLNQHVKSNYNVFSNDVEYQTFQLHL